MIMSGSTPDLSILEAGSGSGQRSDRCDRTLSMDMKMVNDKLRTCICLPTYRKRIGTEY